MKVLILHDALRSLKLSGISDNIGNNIIYWFVAEAEILSHWAAMAVQLRIQTM